MPSVEEAAVVEFVFVAIATNVGVVTITAGTCKFALVTIGLVSVLFVRVCNPVRVETVESIAIVVAVEPLNEVPNKPVPMVNGLVVVPPPPPAETDPSAIKNSVESPPDLTIEVPVIGPPASMPFFTLKFLSVATEVHISLLVLVKYYAAKILP
jgi:hypothetical protein